MIHSCYIYKKSMRNAISIFLLATAFVGCKPRILSGKDLEDKLKSTMKNYLDTAMAPGTQVNIQNLYYFTDTRRKRYICNFTVHVHNSKLDTTGIMVATIPNDFSKVDRTQ